MMKKAVILAAGSATRIQDGAERYIKNGDELEAVRLGEKMAARFSNFPFLDFQVLNLVLAGLKKVNIVLKPNDRFFTEHYSEKGPILFPEIEISFSFQEKPDGTAHAVYAARGFTGDDEFLLLNGDNNYSTRSVSMLLDRPSNMSGMVGFDIAGFNEHTRARLKSFAVIRTGGGRLVDIVEKASDPERCTTRDTLYGPDNGRAEVNGILTSMNLWAFRHGIMEACGSVERHKPRKPGKEGEFELPDAVKLLIERGEEFRVYYAKEDVLDLTRSEDIALLDERIRGNLADAVTDLTERYERLSG